MDASLSPLSPPLDLYPAIEPYASGRLPVDNTHTLYWETCGNPEGVPVVFLHGGPGAGATPDHRRFFDPEFYRIVIFDQRGAGRSQPLGELQHNSPTHLIADLEQLRLHLGIEKWLVFGGSWGSTLALAYGETHPERCLGFVLRGVFLMRPEEIRWFMEGVRRFIPEAWEKFVQFILPEERHDVLHAYYRRLTDSDPAVHLPAAKMFSGYEAAMSTLLPNTRLVANYCEDVMALGLGRIEAHYFLHYATTELGEKLLHQLPRITHLPAIIVQGRYDLCCPPITAYEVAQAWPAARLVIVPDAGHTASEPGIRRELISATEQFKEWLATTSPKTPSTSDH